MTKQTLVTIWLLVLAGFAFSAGANPQEILVVGHKHPDTDAIVSAIAIAELKSRQGIPAKAVAQGEPNAETRFVLKKFGFNAPPVQTSFADRQVILVDHSDRQLAPDDLDQARLVGIYDHHRLGGLVTDEPIEVIIKPWGSTATIIYELFAQEGLTIEGPLAGLLLSGILSDTRIFKSPTATEHDRRIATALAMLAGVSDLEAYGRQMLQAYNEDMVKLKDIDLVQLDLKPFNMSQYKIAIAQLESFDASFLNQRVVGLRDALQTVQTSRQLDAMVLAITDLSRGGSTILAVGPQASKVELALELTSDPLGTFKPDVFSRKLQLLPPLERVFKH